MGWRAGRDMKNRVAAVILTYRPTPCVERNIIEVLRQVDRVFVINNESAGTCAFPSINNSPKVFFHNNKDNLGVATGFNQGIKHALNAGYEYIVLFDQDSIPGEGMISLLANFCAERMPNPVIVGPTLFNVHSGKLMTPDWGAPEKLVDVVISSGMMISKAVVDATGLHNEDLFIDFVDHEFCLRAQGKGVQVFQLHAAKLYHTFGNSRRTSFLGREICLLDYSPIRHYYRSRNFLFLLKTYGWGDWAKKEVMYFIKEWLKIFLLEKDVVPKLRGCLNGIISFYARRL